VIAAVAILALLSTFGVIVEGITLTNTLAGAIAPILTALLFIPVRKIIRSAEANHDVTKAEAADLRTKLREAEAAIRGDLKNGVKATVDRVEAKVDQVAEQLPEPGPEPPPHQV
jgi:hypothetical protein